MARECDQSAGREQALLHAVPHPNSLWLCYALFWQEGTVAALLSPRAPPRPRPPAAASLHLADWGSISSGWALVLTAAPTSLSA